MRGEADQPDETDTHRVGILLHADRPALPVSGIAAPEAPPSLQSHQPLAPADSATADLRREISTPLGALDSEDTAAA